MCITECMKYEILMLNLCELRIEMDNKRVNVDLHKYFVTIFLFVMITLFLIVTFAN